MLPDLMDIKRLRIKLGLTQTSLSKLCGVSQSIIAKIERGYNVPNYVTAKRIFTILKELELKDELRASDIMTRNVISVEPGDMVSKVINLFSEHKISQCPVIEDKRVLGSVTERTVINNLHKPDFKELKISEVMDESFPIMGLNTPLSVISTVIKEFPVVIISDCGETKGIISKSDLFKII